MKYTSAQANKLLKKLQSECSELLIMEEQAGTFVAATTEDLEGARPAYDYAGTRTKLARLEAQIRMVRHAISVFNLTHTVEGFDMTVDQLLVYIPQLTARKNRLFRMAGTLPKARVLNNNRTNLIEYTYANYDVQQAKADYDAVSDELARAQLALDHLNNTETMEIEL